MFDNNVFVEGSAKNFCVNGEIEGFEMKTHITYYRGIPLSMVHDVKVFEDGFEVNRDDILFSIDDNDFFTLRELTTVTTYKWEFGEMATVRVKKKGGLQKGEHTIKLVVGVRVAYVPVPFIGEKTRTVII